MIFSLLAAADAARTVGSVLLALLILLAMVTVHEFGHYAAGKLLHFRIEEFSVGFGPKLFSRAKKNGEVFSVRLLPLGGYCAFAGGGRGGCGPGRLPQQGAVEADRRAGGGGADELFARPAAHPVLLRLLRPPAADGAGSAARRRPRRGRLLAAGGGHPPRLRGKERVSRLRPDGRFGREEGGRPRAVHPLPPGRGCSLGRRRADRAAFGRGLCQPCRHGRPLAGAGRAVFGGAGGLPRRVRLLSRLRVWGRRSAVPSSIPSASAAPFSAPSGSS